MKFIFPNEEERILKEYFADDKEKLADARARLAKGEPIAYIVGETVFYNERYHVTPDVLIPRPDTERVVDQIIARMPRGGSLLDLCCGSGCIAISSLMHSRALNACALDISEAAINIARENADSYNLLPRMEFFLDSVENDSLFEGKKFDIIASNPPYVKSDVVPTLEVGCSYEPKVAFDGGKDGMDFYRLIVERYAGYLKPNGCFVFEIGYDQKADIIALAKSFGYSCEVYRDFGGNDRVAVIYLHRYEFSNPIDEGCYADPEARYYNGRYYIYCTRSLPFRDQHNHDCFRSDDLVRWTKIEGVIDEESFPHVTHAVWAPTIIEKGRRYYYVFASNNIQSDDEVGGIEIGVSNKPEGPFKALLDRPLIDHFVNGAQPIDPHLFKDDDGTIYLYFGGWGHCNVAKMNDDMTGFVPFENGETFIEITPPDYVEGPCMMKKNGEYYFMWSSGNWTDDSYCVKYCRAQSPIGPFDNEKVILSSDETTKVGRGPGHHGYLELPGSGDTLIVYHRHKVGDNNGNHRYICIDRLDFDENGEIKKVEMT